MKKTLLSLALILGCLALAHAQIDPATIIAQRNGVVVSEIYPNPASSEAFINYTMTYDAPSAYIEVVNVLGQPILKQSLRPENTSLRISLDGLKQGVYFYRIEIGGQKGHIHKFIVHE